MGRFVEYVPALAAKQQASVDATALSPWPTEAVALAAATDALAAALGENDEATVRRLGSTAAALVERYAPAAPQSIRNEATIRCSGWLGAQPSAAIRDEKVGELAISYNPASMSALRHSGAAAILSPWKIRRAGRIG